MQLGERVLGVGMRRGLLARQVGRREFGLVARRLDLLDERVLIGSEAGVGQDLRVEALLLGVGGAGVQPRVEILEHAAELGNGFESTHGMTPFVGPDGGAIAASGGIAARPLIAETRTSVH